MTIVPRILAGLCLGGALFDLPIAWAAVPADHAERLTRGAELFRQEIAPVLREHCLPCHGGEKTKADFDLATREGLLRGGKDGEVVRPFDAAGSRLLRLVRHEEAPEMPDKKPKLPASVTASLATWIELGAPYSEPLVAGRVPPRDKSRVTAADRDWWAFRPLSKVTPPTAAAHPVDAFLLAAVADRQLTFNPPADASTLLRRLHLELTGLPPTPDEVSAFAAARQSDPAMAVRTVVRRLLAAPEYGERWARHWLDVARFAESSGFEHDYDRPYAFHYRDFVIRAFNADLPFDQFARWQLAGDEFEPENPEALMATGFLGAGVFPTQITANEVERTRYDALDDMLSTTGSAFLGLTIGCARCHDHKFDPIPASDYYRLLSSFTTTVRSVVELPEDPAVLAPVQAAFEQEHQRLRRELEKYEGQTLRAKFEQSLASGRAEWTQAVWLVPQVTEIGSTAGAVFQRLPDDSWLATGPNGEHDTYTFTFTTSRRGLTGLKLEALTDPSMKARGPGRADNGNFALSHIRVQAAPLAGGAIREITLRSPQATHEQNAAGLSVASSLDADPHTGWAVDGGGIGKDQAAMFGFAEPVDFAGGATVTVTLEFAVNSRHNLGRVRFSLSTAAEPVLSGAVVPGAVAGVLAKRDTGVALTSEERTTMFEWWRQRDAGWLEHSSRLAAHAKAAPKSTRSVMICAEGFPPVVMHSQGAVFLPETHQLRRGDPNQKVSVAQPGVLQVLNRADTEARWQWAPPKDAKYAGRRRSLANWLTDVDQGAGALMARVTVNRLWQHHFGRGLVTTVNDFGRSGTLPSNAALLDWLAGELIRQGWRLKPLQELLLTSAAYQQRAATDPAKIAADPDNAWFLRRVPQRLDAETARDAMLSVADLLDPTRFGPGTLDENSRRRSIYFTVKRSQLVNSMVVFDAPEPLTSQGNRPSTTVAPQALLLMNSPQARAWAEGLARRVQKEAAGGDSGPQVARLFRLALGRLPTATEAHDAAAFLAAGTLTDLCQAILALNEFIYVD